LDAEPPIASFLKSKLIGGGPVNAPVLAGSESYSYSYSGRGRYSYPYSKRRTDADPIFDCERLDVNRYRVDLAVPSSGVDAEMLDGAFRRLSCGTAAE
jgi:hypothetical protein